MSSVGATEESDVLAIDSLLSADELAVREKVRDFTSQLIRPGIAGWYDGCDFGRQPTGYEQRTADIRDTVAADLHGFDAEQGQQLVIETRAAMLGSPADTKIEVLDAKGAPVPQMVLQGPSLPR